LVNAWSSGGAVLLCQEMLVTSHYIGLTHNVVRGKKDFNILIA